MQNKKIIIVSILVILILGLFVIQKVILKPSKNNLSSMPTPKPQPTVTVEPSIDIPRDWQSYNGKDYAFKYPKDGKLNTQIQGMGDSTRIYFMGEKQIKSGRTQTELADGYMFIVTKLPNNPNLTPMQKAEEQRKISTDQCNLNVPPISLTQIENIKIGNNSGVKYSVLNCGMDTTNSYVQSNGNIYEIVQAYTGDKEDYENYKQITNQIFSTLHFN